jgi:hypothetical protein
MDALKISFRPPDLGYDPRQHEWVVVVPEVPRLEVRYLDRDDEEHLVVGTFGAVVEALTSAGYTVAAPDPD